MALNSTFGKFFGLRSVFFTWVIFVTQLGNGISCKFVRSFLGIALLQVWSYDRVQLVDGVYFGAVLNSRVSSQQTESDCDVLIDYFTDASVNYTRCIIQHAKSYKRCQSCVDEYRQVDKSYRTLGKQNHSCPEEYHGLGDLEVYNNVYDFVKKNWEAGGCQNCFGLIKVNDTVSNELSNTTKRFLWLSLQFYQCIFNDTYFIYNLQAEDKLQLTSGNATNKTICQRCLHEYKSLNGFYVSNFEKIYDKETIICADIADSMNFTRYVWQEIYRCPISHASVWPIIVASLVLCSLPVVFYVASKIFGHEVKPNVVLQKRFRRISGSRSTTRVSSASEIVNHFPM